MSKSIGLVSEYCVYMYVGNCTPTDNHQIALYKMFFVAIFPTLNTIFMLRCICLVFIFIISANKDM